MKLSYHDFFTTYFPDSALVVAKFDKGTADIILECVPSKKHLITPFTKEDLNELKTVNDAGYSVFFTPNAVKEDLGAGATHTLDNFGYVNACYIDIDIESTKECVFDEDFQRREDKKAEIAGVLWSSDPAPSLVIESRNGYQCYWFTSCQLDQFKRIQKGIFEKYKSIGADAAALKEVQLMRVSGFWHNKERIKCEIRPELCTWNEDGSLKFYDPDLLEKSFPTTIQKLKEIKKDYKKTTFTMFNNPSDVFRKILKMDILEVMRKMSGTKLTGGDTLEFIPSNNGKVQIRCNGKMSPNWLDTNLNMVFSNNIQKFCNPIHFAMYYGLSKLEIANEFKKLLS